MEEGCCQVTANRITHLFEQTLLRRCELSADDRWVLTGREAFKGKVYWFVRRREPIQFLLPGLPFKSKDTEKKVLSSRPGMVERLILGKLERFLTDVGRVYSKGGRLVIFSDGRLYSQALSVPQRVIRDYLAEIRRLNTCTMIQFHDLQDHYPEVPDQNVMEFLKSEYGSSRQSVESRMAADRDFARLYYGFLGDVQDYLPNWRKRSAAGEGYRKQAIQSTVYQLLFIKDAFDRFLTRSFPQHVRLSFSPSGNGPQKFSVQVMNAGDACLWTVCKGCAVRTAVDGKEEADDNWMLIAKETAEKRGYRLAVSDEGFAYYVANTSANTSLNRIDVSTSLP